MTDRASLTHKEIGSKVLEAALKECVRVFGNTEGCNPIVALTYASYLIKFSEASLEKSSTGDVSLEMRYFEEIEDKLSTILFSIVNLCAESYMENTYPGMSLDEFAEMVSRPGSKDEPFKVDDTLADN